MLGRLVKQLLRRLLLPTRSDIASGSRGIALLLNEAEACMKANDTLRAQQALQRIIQLEPDHAEALYRLGCIARDNGQIDAAISWVARALTIDPRAARFHNTCGNLWYAKGELAEAAKRYGEAAQLDPKFAEAHANLGMVLCETGETERGVAFLRKAIEIDPGLYEAHNSLGIALVSQGGADKAVAALTRAVELKPDSAEAYNNLALALQQLGRIDDAIVNCRRALELNPGFADAHNSMGTVLREAGRVDEAVASYRRALELDPELANTHSNLLLALNYSADYTPGEVFQEHLEWARRHAAPLKRSISLRRKPPVPDRRLRIGYVSPDFREHAVSYCFEPTLVHHDYGRFEIFCYSAVRRPDACTQRMRGYPCVWRDIAGQSDAAAAEVIAGDEIDILVDLSGHTAEHRLLVFARKPAPIQVTWNGYPNTTGMDAMDYRITDAYADPPGTTEHLHTEQLVRLPEIYMAYLPPAQSPPVAPAPCLANGHVTFGSFNALYKLGPQVVAAWAQILRALPSARLMILSVPDGSARARLAEAFARHGVEAERLELIFRLPFQQFLEAHQRVDIALDSFPYNGTTTTCQTLWMGVPLIALAGASHVSRVGVSMLSNVGLERLVARDVGEYVSLAVALAQDPRELSTLRAGVRERMLASPNTDGLRLTRFLEAAYTKMWKDYCSRADTCAS